MILIGAAFYYYNRYSAIIDAGLRGDIFVRSAGIYAAPLTIRDGSGTRMTDVLNHLKKIGYQQQQGGAVANNNRGYYSSARNNAIDIHPGNDAKIDGEKAFPNIRVTFGRSRRHSEDRRFGQPATIGPGADRAGVDLVGGKPGARKT